jgi:hypothetical protein
MVFEVFHTARSIGSFHHLILPVWDCERYPPAWTQALCGANQTVKKIGGDLCIWTLAIFDAR